MNIPKTIVHLYPQAKPMIDFVVQDDGSTPALREGVDGRTRYTIKPLEEEETEEVEGVHYYYRVNFNNLVEGVDYDIVNRGPYIAAWNLPVPQPTDAELEAAWDELHALPPAPEPSTPEQRISQLESENTTTMLAITEVYEGAAAQNASREQETTEAMLALTEAYELVMLQAETIDTLTARIEVLEATQKGGRS